MNQELTVCLKKWLTLHAEKKQLDALHDEAFEEFSALWEDIEGDSSVPHESEPEPLEQVFRGPALNKIILADFANHTRGKDGMETRKAEDWRDLY